jgi:hypothetical protein
VIKLDKYKTEKPKEINLATQNDDTNIAVFNTDDTRPYEQKNMPKGAVVINKNKR